MADDLSGERFDELVTRVLAPIVLGGQVRPVRPFGARLARVIGQQRTITDAALRSSLDVARVRRARLIAPVDTVEPLGEADFALAAGLNDLLQATNHELGGLFTRGRHARLIGSVAELCRLVAAPRTIGEALSRYSTFCRVLELSRTDTHVSWWTGSASFRGQRPPPRLLLWPSFRRVSVNESRVALKDMCKGLMSASEDLFFEALGLWLSRTPLSDLGSVTRQCPQFAWSPSTLSLVATPPGRTLAWRLLAGKPAAEVVPALERATKQIAPAANEARAIAEAFLKEVTEGFAALEEQRGRPRAGREGQAGKAG